MRNPSMTDLTKISLTSKSTKETQVTLNNNFSEIERAVESIDIPTNTSELINDGGGEEFELYSGYTSFINTSAYVGYYVFVDPDYIKVTNSNKDSLNISAGTTKAYISSPYATRDYVEKNGGKIDSISVNNSAQTIDQYKNVNINIKSIDSTNTTALTPNASETVNGTGTIKLHKIAKTGTFSDLINIPKYGTSLSVSGTSVQLKDQDGNNLGSSITTQDTGATVVSDTGTGNAYTSASYDSTNRTITFTKGETFVKTSDVDSSLSTLSTNPIQNKVVAELIPSQATSSNQLADKNFVNSSINALAAYYLTKDAAGNAFDTKAQLDSATTFYSGGVTRTPTQNDYAIIKADISQANTVTGYTSFTTTAQYIGYHVLYNNIDTLVTSDNKDTLSITPGTTICYYSIPTTRYIYQGTWNTGNFSFQYIVNDTALTAAQIAAINSGITSTLVTQIGTNQSNISTLDTNKADKSSTVSSVSYNDSSKKIQKTINGTTTDVATFAAGSNVSLSSTNGTLTISATDTTYENKAASQGGTDVSLVTTGEKYTWNNKQDLIDNSHKLSSDLVDDSNSTENKFFKIYSDSTFNIGSADITPGIYYCPNLSSITDSPSGTRIAKGGFLSVTFSHQNTQREFVYIGPAIDLNGPPCIISGIYDALGHDAYIGTGIVDNLTTQSSLEALSAKQGYILNQNKQDKYTTYTFTTSGVGETSSGWSSIDSDGFYTLTIASTKKPFICYNSLGEQIMATLKSNGTNIYIITDTKFAGSVLAF